ncbi:MAG: hypothetical protein KJ732_00440 [Candidatus Margulisbacteria bacterium]|nr:hypothetical protein [Candidatus Margulisiibacteriota bacterium]
MNRNKPEGSSSSVTVNGVTFKTGGNIVFAESDDASYYLAEGSQLEKIEGMLEHGMQMLLKKIKN